MLAETLEEIPKRNPLWNLVRDSRKKVLGKKYRAEFLNDSQKDLPNESCKKFLEESRKKFMDKWNAGIGSWKNPEEVTGGIPEVVDGRICEGVPLGILDGVLGRIPEGRKVKVSGRDPYRNYGRSSRGISMKRWSDPEKNTSGGSRTSVVKALSGSQK